MTPYNPILTDKTEKTKTFRIANLFYIALFGGVYALTVLGLINSRMLQMKGIRLFMLVLSSLAVIAAKVSFYLLEANHIIQLDPKFGFTLFKLTDLLLFLVYYHLLKVPYRIHMIYHAEYYNLSYRGVGVLACLSGSVSDYLTIVYLYS